MWSLCHRSYSPQRSIADLSTTLHQSRDLPIHATIRSIYEYRIDLHSRLYGLYFDRARITCQYIHADIWTRCQLPLLRLQPQLPRLRCGAFLLSSAHSTFMPPSKENRQRKDLPLRLMAKNRSRVRQRVGSSLTTHSRACRDNKILRRKERPPEHR